MFVLIARVISSDAARGSCEGEAGCLTNDNDEFLMFELPKLMQNACHEFFSFTIVFREKKKIFSYLAS